VFLLAALVPAPPAGAHLVQTGLGRFADDVARLVPTPSDLMLVCGLAALVVQRGAAWSVRLRLALPLAWGLGGILGLRLPVELSTPWPGTIAFSLVGLLVALQVPVGRRVHTAGVVSAGLWCGLVNGSALPFHSGAVPALAPAPPHPAWLRIGLRVAGSWFSASGLLMVGWIIELSS
jgi:hypothetical protein